jgi:hypothetical protein
MHIGSSFGRLKQELVGREEPPGSRGGGGGGLLQTQCHDLLAVDGKTRWVFSSGLNLSTSVSLGQNFVTVVVLGPLFQFGRVLEA